MVLVSSIVWVLFVFSSLESRLSHVLRMQFLVNTFWGLVVTFTLHFLLSRVTSSSTSFVWVQQQHKIHQILELLYFGYKLVGCLYILGCVIKAHTHTRTPPRKDQTDGFQSAHTSAGSIIFLSRSSLPPLPWCIPLFLLHQPSSPSSIPVTNVIVSFVRKISQIVLENCSKIFVSHTFTEHFRKCKIFQNEPGQEPFRHNDNTHSVPKTLQNTGSAL